MVTECAHETAVDAGGLFTAHNKFKSSWLANFLFSVSLGLIGVHLGEKGRSFGSSFTICAAGGVGEFFNFLDGVRSCWDVVCFCFLDVDKTGFLLN